MGDRHPLKICFARVKSNSTVEFHECMCDYDYSLSKMRVKALKMTHCHKAAEMSKMGNFYSYVVAAALVIVCLVALVASICSFKWYMETKKNPCTCCSFFCCCNKRKKRRRKKDTDENQTVNVFEQNETGHTWSPINLPPLIRDDENESVPTTPTDDSKDPSICMNFCLSDPVQDCCEFFDCDIMWRKKSVYTIPIFGRKKQHLQRRPARPAPPPPKAVVLPQIKSTDTVIFDEYECEPVPEAPPSPEPIRTLPAKAIYVDPLAFLQRTFVKNAPPDKNDLDEIDGKQEALYSKFKNMVLAKVKKSVSIASINKLGVFSHPNNVSSNPAGSSGNKKKTASLASLHNLGEAELDKSYGSKRSLSLASLHMLQEQGAINNGITLDPRSRISIMSTISTATDDIPPSARKDEYIDLEEMSKRIEATMLAAQSLNVSQVPSPQPYQQSVPQSLPPVIPSAYTPNFMPASAFVGSQNFSSFSPIQQVSTSYDNAFERQLPIQYFPPVPASQGRPAVPARTAAPIYSMSPSGTLGRSKPVVPPRPPAGDAARVPISPNTNTLPRSPRLVKPSSPPPPPPPGSKIPIESSI